MDALIHRCSFTLTDYLEPTMRRDRDDFRCRYGAAMNRARTIERQAAGLREGLGRLAGGEAECVEVQNAIAAIREQLDMAERLADEMHSSFLIERGE